MGKDLGCGSPGMWGTAPIGRVLTSTVWRWLPDMVVGDVCAQARRHLHNGLGALRVPDTRELVVGTGLE